MRVAERRQVWLICRWIDGKLVRLGNQRYTNEVAAKRGLDRLVMRFESHARRNGLGADKIATYRTSHCVIELMAWNQHPKALLTSEPPPAAAGGRAPAVPVEPYRLAPAGHDR